MMYSLTVGDVLVRAFADLSGDFNAIHVDDEFAARSQFGRRIAHGPVPLSVVIGNVFGGDWPTGVELRAKFVAPVPVDTDVSWTPTDEKPGHGEIVDANGRPVIAFELGVEQPRARG